MARLVTGFACRPVTRDISAEYNQLKNVLLLS